MALDIDVEELVPDVPPPPGPFPDPPVVEDTWLLASGPEVDEDPCPPDFAALIRLIGCAHALPSAQVESGQPHSSCLARAAARATLCFSIS